MHAAYACIQKILRYDEVNPFLEFWNNLSERFIMKVLKMILLFILMAACVILIANSVRSSGEFNCRDYEFIFARGSGQKLNDNDFAAFKAAIVKNIEYEKVGFYELGQRANGYPAVAADFSVSLGAIVSAGESYKFGESVDRGVSELVSYIKSKSKQCGKTKFILAGYSQGAMVIDKSLKRVDSEKILYAANFGDPKLYLPEWNRKCKKENFSNYRVDVPCGVKEGILGGQNPYQPAEYFNKLGVWCNEKDIMCGSGLNILNPLGGHTSYFKKNKYEDFAKIVAEKIRAENAIEGSILSKETSYFADPNKRDIIVVYDFREVFDLEFRKNGKSINDELKERLIKFAEEGARIAVYNAYSLISPVKYLEQKIAFTNENLAEKIDEYNEKNKRIFGYSEGASNNNFWALRSVIETAKWRENSDRNIFLLTNSLGGVTKSFDGTSFEDVIEIANKNYVKISILSTKRSYLDIYNEQIAKSTNGLLVGGDFANIKLNQNNSKKLFTKTFEINQKSKYTVVAINGMVYGITDRKTITVVDLNENAENSINFISFDDDGNHKDMEVITFPAANITAPNTGIV